MMRAPQFVHLHVHSEYSLEDGIIPVGVNFSRGY